LRVAASLLLQITEIAEFFPFFLGSDKDLKAERFDVTRFA
jgi:hypothetical protein